MSDFLRRLDGVSRNGVGWKARCPAHDDRVASLSVTEGDNGRVLAHCHAGCSFEEVVTAAGVPRRVSREPSAPDLTILRGKSGVIAEYDYTDADGNLLYQVLRKEDKSGFPQRRPDGRGGWINNLQGVSPVPYHLPELIEAAALGRQVFVAEGEKDVDNLRALGLTATCNSGGAGKWRDEHALHFHGVPQAIVLADNDEAGEAHARRVAESLRPIVPDVRILRFPELPPKGDVSDWLAQGHTLAELCERIEHPAPRAVLPTVQLMIAEPPAAQSMHIDRRLVDRDINITVSHGGTGKSIEANTVGVCVAVERPLYGTLPVKRTGPVLLIVPEDGHAGARMMVEAIAAGMKLDDRERRLLAERLHIVTDDASVNITRDAALIADTALALGAVLVVLDPKINLLGGEPENDNDIAGKTCDALRREVCRRAGATVLLTDHLRKPGKDTPDAAPTQWDARGGGAWVNSARLAFSLVKKGNRRTLTAIKANRIAGDIRHELELHIEADPINEAHWISCQLTDANAGASSDALTPGRGRSLNANEQAVLGALDDRHEPGKRLSWSRWKDDAGLANGNTFKSVKDRLIDAALVTALPTGKKTRNGSPEYAYEITPAGRSALAAGWTNAPAKGERVSNGE